MNLLLLAQSARMLAQSAHRAGLNTSTIDYFADADIRRYASRALALPPESNEMQWLEAAELLAPKGEGNGFIYGSGIDTRPRLVEALAQGRILFGNPPSILKQVNEPRRFFDLLAELGIPHPETRFSPPQNLEGWLVKPSCGEGGKGVGFAAKNRPATTAGYYQRHVQGEALSVLFLANGKQARVLGFNTQWTASHDPSQPFLFAGAVNRARLSDAQRSKLETYVESLSSALGLVGLNSLDFILEGDKTWVIELNPRPSATMALYDEDFAEGLLQAHIEACRGRLPPIVGRPSPVRAFRYVFAPQTIRPKESYRWPDCCADIPPPGTEIATGQPLCSLMAQGDVREAVEAWLKAKETELLRDLMQTEQGAL